ncbi:hypothetical protein J0R59_004558 [Salmonella enterica subsp. enterica serovar Isangi]|nr:hypothetical protein [Salmonella enterica subsp. enterica serovar Isangi]
MKKTLIALAVAASAVVSGSAMAAWTQNGAGGNLSIGGDLTPVAKVTPWEVEVGAAVATLNADVQKGQANVDVLVKSSIPVLGIRSNNANGFKGAPAIDPQINYGGKVDIDTMRNGVATLTLDVNSGGQKIGTLSAPLWVAAQAHNGTASSNVMLMAPTQGDGFFGGVAKTKEGVWNSASATSWATTLFPGIADNWNDAGNAFTGGAPTSFNFTSTTNTYNAYYASGIDKSETIKITLDQVVAADTPIQWTASLPIAVTYE